MKKHSLFFICIAASLAFISKGSAAPKTFKVFVSGHGQPAIFIPGLACPGSVWDTTVAHYEGTFECHVVSIDGFGKIPPTDLGSEPLLPLVREELATYINEHRLEKPVIVGHSLGGFVALDLAIHHPDLPGELVIVDSLPFLLAAIQPDATVESARKAAQMASSSFQHMDRATYSKMVRGGPNGSTMATKDKDLERIVNWGVASDGATVAKAMTELYTTDLRRGISKISCPTMVIGTWLGYAPYSSHAHAEEVFSEQYRPLKGARIEIVDTARHFVMLDDPEWLFEKMDSFLHSTY